MFHAAYILSVLFSVTGIATGNETGIHSDVLGDPLALCGSIIYILNCSTRSSLTKALFLVIIEDLMFFLNGHENMVLHATPSPRVRDMVKGWVFIKKLVFR